MPEQHIKTVLEQTLGYTWFIILAMWGGTASYLSRLKKTDGKFSIIEIFGEWTISGFSGIITAYFCNYFNLDFYITSALVGISGHMGGRAIYIIEMALEKRANRFNL